MPNIIVHMFVIIVIVSVTDIPGAQRSSRLEINTATTTTTTNNSNDNNNNYYYTFNTSLDRKSVV